MARRKGNGQGSLHRRSATGPWVARWHDHTGRRRQKTTGTTSRKVAERLLAHFVAHAALRRDGVVNAQEDGFAVADCKPLAQHVSDYLTACEQAGQAAKNIDEKRRHLRRLRETTGATRLSDLTADALERHLAQMHEAGKSARTRNFARQAAVAFLNWCRKRGRIGSNPLSIVPKADERRDRRRTRRPLTDAELGRLFAVAEARGRGAWYTLAALAGLRRGELRRLEWRDIDLAAATVTVRDGKAKRTDTIPLHPDAAEALRQLCHERTPMPLAKVFPTTVTDLTRRKDFARAGIPEKDAAGRIADFHALRTTLGTNLARAGVAPQHAQKIMRHADYRTTLAHYTVLGLTDTRGAISKLGRIARCHQAAATGTEDAKPAKGRATSSATNGGAKQRYEAIPGEGNEGEQGPRGRTRKPR